MLCCIVGVLVVVASDSTQTYNVAVCFFLVKNHILGTRFAQFFDLQVVGFLAAGLAFNSSVVNALVYSPDSAKEAAAAGFILLSMISVRFLFPSHICIIHKPLDLLGNSL